MPVLLPHLFGIVLTLGAPAAAGPGQPVNPTGAAILAFKTRVAEYVKVHQDAKRKVVKLEETNDPQKVHQHEVALGEAIRTLRADAKEGDVIGADFRPILEREVREDFRSRPARDRKALVEELPAKIALAVNMHYPADLPLATFPPKLLRKLPDLPPELEYRIVGRHLILRDAVANVIVDIARDVVPTIPS